MTMKMGSRLNIFAILHDSKQFWNLILSFEEVTECRRIHRSKLYSFVEEKSNTTTTAMNTGFVAEFETYWGDGM